jgi:hypothetical protein
MNDDLKRVLSILDYDIKLMVWVDNRNRGKKIIDFKNHVIIIMRTPFHSP